MDDVIVLLLGVVAFRIWERAGIQDLDAAVWVLYKRSNTEVDFEDGNRVSRAREAVDFLEITWPRLSGCRRLLLGIVLRVACFGGCCGTLLTAGVLGGVTPTGSLVEDVTVVLVGGSDSGISVMVDSGCRAS